MFGWDELWQLQIDGTIAENIQNAQATWTKSTVTVPPAFKPKTGAAGTVTRPLTNPQYSLLSFGGCDSVTEGNATCAGGDAHLVTAGSTENSWNTIAQCPSARYGAVLAQNHNDAFEKQVFMLFGLSDPHLYDDGNLTTHGEIGVLSIAQGVWSRVLPSCDPGNGTGTPECPVPREGAAVISSRTNLFTGALDASDTIVFGGRDKDGNYLNDVWMLRATNRTITHTNQTDWGPEYGTGVLGSGKFQNGQGVTVQVREAVREVLCSTKCSVVQFLDQCTVKKNVTSPTSSGNPDDPTNTQGGPSDTNTLISAQYDTSVVHKSLAGASVVAILPALVLFRASSPIALAQGPSTRPILLLVSVITFTAAWLSGVIGFVISIVTLSFTPASMLTSSSLHKRADEEKGHFRTPHGIAGLVIFALVYFVLPLSIAMIYAQGYHEQYERRHSRVSNSSSGEGEYKDDPGPPPNSPPARPRQSSSADKLFRRSMATTPDLSNLPPDAENDADGDPIGAGERVRLREGRFAPSAFFKERLWPSGWGRPRSQHGLQAHSHLRSSRLSPEPKDDNASRHSYQNHSASPSTATAAAPANETGFVVLNRNKNALVQQAQGQRDGARGLAEDRENSAWLYLRRNLNYMGDVDYMISKIRGTASPAAATVVAKNNSNARKVALRYPSLGVVVGRILAQVVLLALVVFCAMSIAVRGGDGPVGNTLLALFVFWAVACYAAMYWLAWNGRPRGSVLVVAISRLRGQQHEELDAPTEMDEHGAFSDAASHQAASTLGGATYASRPVYRRVHDSVSGAQVDDDDDDNDRLEEELGRRDVRAAHFRMKPLLMISYLFFFRSGQVSIVTVPKRPLFVTNAGPS